MVSLVLLAWSSLRWLRKDFERQEHKREIEERSKLRLLGTEKKKEGKNEKEREERTKERKEGKKEEEREKRERERKAQLRLKTERKVDGLSDGKCFHKSEKIVAVFCSFFRRHETSHVCVCGFLFCMRKASFKRRESFSVKHAKKKERKKERKKEKILHATKWRDGF